MPRAKPKPPPAPAEFFSVGQAADRMTISESAVRRLIYGSARAPAVLPHARLGVRCVRIPVAAVLEYLAAETRLGVD